MLNYYIRNHNALDLCDLWTKIQNKVGIKITDENNTNILLGNKTQSSRGNIDFDVIIVNDKSSDGILEKLYMRNLKDVEEMIINKEKP